MIPYLLWLWLIWRCSALKCGVRSKLKSCKMTEGWYKSLHFFPCWWKSFPMSLWLLCILTWTLTWIQTNKKQNKHAWAFKKRTQTMHLISQNHINHNSHPLTSHPDACRPVGLSVRSHWKVATKTQMKWQGLDLHGFVCLLSQVSLISSMLIDFNDMIRAQYRVDDPSACTTA